MYLAWMIINGLALVSTLVWFIYRAWTFRTAPSCSGCMFYRDDQCTMWHKRIHFPSMTDCSRHTPVHIPRPRQPEQQRRHVA